MSSTTEQSPPHTPQSGSVMLPSPLQLIPGNDDLNSSPAPNGSPRSPLTPADCRTLSKILSEVHSLSSPSIPDTSEQDESLPGDESFAAEGNGIQSGNEDEVRCHEERYDCGEEVEDGYEDEDKSMELADTQELEAEENAGDTVKHFVNLPGKTADLAQAQDFGSFELDGPGLDRQEKTTAAHDVSADIAVVNEQQGDDLSDSEGPVFQALQDEIGMCAVIDDGEASGELEAFEGYRNASSPAIPFRSIARRESEDTPPLSSLFVTFPGIQPAVVQTPGAKHNAFASNVTMPDTPFTSTIKYFKQYKGKENSPSKGRRNASSPEEIAQLAQEAQEEEDLEDLDKYRDMDLAPVEPVMESSSAGDLITFGTPAKHRNLSYLSDCWSPSMTVQQNSFQFGGTNDEGQTPQEQALESSLKIRENTEQPAEQRSTSLIPSQVIAQKGSNDSHAEGPETISNPEQKQLILYPQDPTFVTVIGMLPATIIWVTAAPIVKYTSKAFDMLVETLTGLKL